MRKPSRFEIFCIEDSGPRWVAVAETVEQAKSTVLVLDRGWGTQFVISNELTGERIVFNGHYFLANEAGNAYYSRFAF